MTGVVPVIETERLVLRGPVLGDFEAYADLMASERSRHCGGPLGRRDAWNAFSAESGLWCLRGFGMWTLEDKSSGSVVGWAGVYFPDYYDEPELGWNVTGDFEGQGLAFEASVAAREHAATAFELTGLISFIATGNARSIRLADRLGARPEREGVGPYGRFLAYRHPTPKRAA